MVFLSFKKKTGKSSAVDGRSHPLARLHIYTDLRTRSDTVRLPAEINNELY